MTNETPAIGILSHAMLIPGELGWSDLLAGTSAIHPINGEFAVPVGASVPCPTRAPQDWPHPLIPRAVSLAAQCLDDLERDPERNYAVVLGMPNLTSDTDYLEHIMPHRHDPEEMAAILGFRDDAALDYFANKLGRNQPRLRVDSACATGNDALITAASWLRSGMVQDVIVIAASAMLNPMGLALFHNLKALNDRDDPWASCPFDARRRGFVMGEGAAAMWLSTSPPKAPLAWLEGWGQSMNAYHFTEPPEDLLAMVNACRMALDIHQDVAYISAHGTGTRANDRAETKLYHHLFGRVAHKIPISSIKSMIGHTLGAAALIEGIVCVEALLQQKAPPTINLSHPDPDCDLDYIPNQARDIHGELALSNAFAFGGHNSSVLFKRGTR